jgi:glycosyltransferase involved in cell wall biosynthesis
VRSIAASFQIKEAENSMSRPLVSILIPTFNRRRYLAQALASALRQTYPNIEVIVINDGGEGIGDIVQSFADDRIVFIDRKQNRGKAYSLNEALTLARGKYITYLDDDDMYYPCHVETLANALEHNPQYGAAYSDLYKTHCRIESDGKRTVLSKIVEVSRDFDRFFLLYFNHVLHVSLMHRRDLLEKTGLYNEDLQILIDWDITRRLSFFTDFLHVPRITGEYYGPVGECDRISVQMRKDVSKYLTNVLKIRTSLPLKPWPKMSDLSIIFIANRLDQQEADTLKSIWMTTFYPFTLILPLPHGAEKMVGINMPNIKYVGVAPLADMTQKIDAALLECEGDYIAIVSPAVKPSLAWVEDPLYAIINSTSANEGLQLAQAADGGLGAVFRKDELLRVRTIFRSLPFEESLAAAKITLRLPQAQELPFRFDDLLQHVRLLEQEGDWRSAAQHYEAIGADGQNALWMRSLALRAWFKAGVYGKAAELAAAINQNRPTVDTLLLEAKIHWKREDMNSAIIALERAKDILEGSELVWK